MVYERMGVVVCMLLCGWNCWVYGVWVVDVLVVVRCVGV